MSTVMDPFNEDFEKFSILVRQMLNNLSMPSVFAKPLIWHEAQKHAPILCLCSPNIRGLPLTTLYDVFHHFQLKTSRSFPIMAETMAVQIAALTLVLELEKLLWSQSTLT